MANSNKTTLVEKLTNIADGFRESRGLTDQLSLDEMATLAAEPSMETQEKTIDYTANGTYELYPDAGYALSKVTANVNVEKPIQEKTVEITTNGTTEITADEGYALSKVTANVNVASKLPQLVSGDGNIELTANDLAGITKIRNYAFYGYTKLTSITIPDGVTSIGNHAFIYCEGLTNVDIPEGVTSIGNWVFRDCTSLTSLLIPASVRSIGSTALQSGSTTNKTYFTFLSTTPPTIQETTFDATKINKIRVPVGTSEAYKTATNWANFANYISEEDG